MLKAKQAFTCLGCSKTYTRKSKLLEHYELPKVKNKGVLVKNKCFQSKTRNYGTSQREVALLKRQKSIVSFQNKNKAIPLGEALPSQPPNINESGPSTQSETTPIENIKMEFQQSGNIGLAGEMMPPSEMLEKELDISPMETLHLPVENNKMEFQQSGNIGLAEEMMPPSETLQK